MFEGKSYGLVMSSLRKAMDPVRAMKAVFVFANYGLIDHKHETGDGYDAFRALLSTQEEDPEEGTRPMLRRGGRIMEMLARPVARAKQMIQLLTRHPRSSGTCQRVSPLARSRQNWTTPSSASWIFLRWKGYGWQLGKIYEIVTRANTRDTSAVQKVQLRIQRADNSKGPASLKVDNYMLMEKMLPLTHGCCLCPRETRLRPRTRDRACTWAGPVV